METRDDPELVESVVDPFPRLEDGPPHHAVTRLTGWFERQEFHPLLTAFLLFIISFLLFQGLASVVALVIIVVEGGLTDAESVLGVLEEATGALLIGNTVGQFLGMAIPVLIWTRLHTRQTRSMLRLDLPDVRLLILSFLGLIALLPIIQVVGEFNEQLPLPEFLEQLEQSQMELIERILTGDTGLFLTFFALAVTPAICEELLFRGYLQRQLERVFGVGAAIAFTGVLFGLYHFRLSQALPLAILGIYLGWLVWRTGSLWIPIVLHLANNGIAIVASKMIDVDPDVGYQTIEEMHVPWSVALAAAVFFAATIYFINLRVEGSASSDPVHTKS